MEKWNSEQRKYFKNLIIFFGLVELSKLLSNFLSNLKESGMGMAQIEKAYLEFDVRIQKHYNKLVEKGDPEVDEFMETHWLNNPQVQQIFLNINQQIYNLFFLSEEQ